MKKLITAIILFNLLTWPIQNDVEAESGVSDNLQSPTVHNHSSSTPEPNQENEQLSPVETEQPSQTESGDGSQQVETSEEAQIQPIEPKVESTDASVPTQTAEEPESSVTEEALVVKSGMVTENGKNYYYDSVTGNLKTGWVYENGKWYYFNLETGEMVTGWVLDGKWYYLFENGEMAIGWVYVADKWYFMNVSGAMQTGWAFVNNMWYYLDASGAMNTGWLLYQNNWYYLFESGAMATGWYRVDHLWYYSYSSGIMASNTSIHGYWLAANGAWYPNFVNPRQDYSYWDLVGNLREFEVNYPGFIKTEIIGQSVDGRNLYALKMGTGKKEIFINGSHHAREHMTTNLIMEMIDEYALAYAKHGSINGYNVRALLDQVTIWFVPMVNPDGVMLVQEGANTANNPQYVLSLNGNSTDFSSWKANIRGVDLNRQYPADWENIAGNTGRPSPSNFKGYQPLSEPEVQAVYNFTKAHSFKIAVAYHSSGRILYWKYKQQSAEYQRDYQIAVKYRGLTGYGLVDPGPNPSGGGYTDWFIQDMKMPGFTPEISTYTFSKPVPIANFEQIWRENQSAGLMLAQEALNL
ncbi:M14 family zinc carboxypeptidase [Neobacillus niacini]|uniref:M14 family zinc carboxypeptidase n=1 Tax=Neobacillus niacini TaxID=86668 RepID=UPI0030015BB0